MATTQTPPRRPAAGRPPTAPPPARPTKGRGGRRGRPRRQRHPFWQGLLMLIQALLILIFVVVLSSMAFLYFSLRGAPSSIDLTFNPPGITKIYAADGTPLARLFVENRQVVPIERIPKNLLNATVALEDKRFYQHSGVDFQGVARALFRNIKSGDVKGQGGSTLTQQLARNMGIEGLTREKSVQRKLHEWIVASQIEKSYTKQQILEMYLNQVNYGQNAFGVQAAAKTYFGKDVDKLDLAQCALLAGLPNRPAVFNPYKDKKAAESQRNIVLDNMREQHYITPDQCAKAKAEFIHLAAPKPPKQGNQIFHAPYFVDYVVDLLKKKYGQDALLRGNLNVYTTLNLTMQEMAEKAVQNGIANARDRGATEGCLVALDPKSGEIRAMVGGTDYSKNQFNIATMARRQPGSSFKAIVYSAAIDSGAFSEQSRVYDAPVTYRSGGKPYTPKDDNGYSYSHVDLRTAMAYSINVPAVKVLKDIGPQTAIFYAHKMGINMETPLSPVLSLALGSSEVSPLEMANVYATIASGGNRPVPTPLTRIADAADKTMEDVPPQVETRVLKPETARQLDDMLRAVVTEPKGTGAGAIDVPEARGKTGTTQGHKDVWFIGYTPQLVVAVWAGHPVHNAKTGRDSNAEMEGGAWGATVCVPIWKSFMLQALPVYKTVLAKEAARTNKPTVQPKPMPPLPTETNLDGSDSAGNGDETDTYYNSRRYRRRHRRSYDNNGDNGYRNRPSAGSPDAATPAVTDAADNPDGTRAATVDNDTGLLAPPGAPNSHRETFATGAAPSVMSPQYDETPSNSAGSGSASDGGNAPRRRTRRRPDNANSPGATGDSTGTGGDNGGDSAPARPRRRASAPRPRPEPEYVTVRVNPNDGKRATRWTPQVVERRFPKGQEPHDYSNLDQPPPGEH